ncbi:MAG TPA: hypothetical protein VKZ49_15270 [Polyangiaceae bacterium]|nr:hypothetical protein [Polyangiaceae bacterium]
MSRDPVRLADLGSEASDELRELLNGAQQDGPTSSELRDLALRLGPAFGAVGITAGIGASGGTGAAATGVGASTAIGSGAAATGAAVAGGTAAKATAVSLAAKLAAGTVVATGLAGGAVWYASQPDAPGEPASAPVSAPMAPAPVPPAEPAVSPEPALAPEVAPEVAPQPTAAVEERSKPAPRTTPLRPGTEAQLLQSAQGALKSDPARALALTQEHRRRFPGGTLSQEREVIAIEALSRLGRTQEAGKRAEDFRRAHPGSVHQRKVQSAVESK